MCGIVGIINNKGMNLSRHLYSATKQMHKRGPDDEGFCLFKKGEVDVCFGPGTSVTDASGSQNYYPLVDVKKTFEDKFTVGLGHRRLSILDLSENGHQPMSDYSGRYWIVFNGEVFNFREIRDELKKLGYQFVSDTDTEVILKAFMCWGERCLKQFNGMFALAIFDMTENKFFIARDRIGIKPLYFFSSEGTFIFASDIKTILATGLVDAEVDMQGLYENLAFGITPRPNTCFKNIYSVEQSTFLWLDADSLEFTAHKYWDVPTGIQDFSLNEGEASELLESELLKSISYQLISDVEVASFMSGGVDSTTISVMASRLYPGIKAFTLGFDKTISRYDETEEAIATAQMNNIDHIVSFLKADVVLDNIEQMVLGYEEPFYHLAPNYAISKIVADHGVKVVFSGLGGDELFAGYALYARWIKFKKFNNFSWLADGIPDGLSNKMDRFKLMVQAETAADFYTQSYMRFNESELTSLFGFNGDAQGRIKRNYLGKDKEFSDDIELLSYLDIKHYIGNHHVHRIDQFTMAHGVEGRFPFLDHHLIEASAIIPSKYKIQPGVQKKVLRNVASKYIHPSCLSMKKKGFGLPLARWYSDELNVLAQDALEGLKKRNIFNITAVDSIINHGSVTHKWQLVMTELWMRSFIDKSFYDESI